MAAADQYPGPLPAPGLSFDRITQISAGTVCHTSRYRYLPTVWPHAAVPSCKQTLLRGLTHTGHLKHFLADQIPKVALLLVQYPDLVMVNLDAGLN